MSRAEWVLQPHVWLKTACNSYHRVPKGPSLCWDVKVGWVPVRAIDPATGRTYTDGLVSTPTHPEDLPHG